MHMVDVFPYYNKQPLYYTMELGEGDLTCGKKVKKFGCITKLTDGEIIEEEETDRKNIHDVGGDEQAD